MIVFCFMVQGQIVLKKESDGNDKKLTGISNKCNTQTVWKPTSVGRLSKKRALNHFCLKLSKMTIIQLRHCSAQFP